MINATNRTILSIALAILVIPIVFLSIRAISAGEYILNPLTWLIAFCLLLIVLRWPESPITFFYPLLWGLWTYQIPVFGKPDRIVALLALVGLAAILLINRPPLPSFPILVTIGIALVLFGILVAWLYNSIFLNIPTDNGTDVLISYLQRVLFLYLTFFHLNTREKIKTSAKWAIASGTAMAALTLLASLMFGAGFIRVYEGRPRAEGFFGSAIHLIYNTQFASMSAVLLMGFYNSLKSKWAKAAALILTFSILWMAFAAQFRREILVTIPILLVFMILDRRLGLRRPAFLLFTLSLVFFLYFLLPGSTVLQERLEEETPSIFKGQDTRLISFTTGVKAFTANIIGYGPGTFSFVSMKILGPGYHYEYRPFNVFVYFAVEGGIFALAGVILIFIGILVQITKTRARLADQDHENPVLRVAGILMLLIFIWFNFGNAIDPSMPWYLMGMILAATTLEQKTLRVNR